MLQVVCSRPPGTRRRLCVDPSNSVPGDFSDGTWFGSYRQGEKGGKIFGTVVVHASPGQSAKVRQLGTGLTGDEAIVQVARDTAALLMQRLQLPKTPRTAVHVLTVAYLQQCVANADPARDQRQVAVLVPVHLYAAVRGHQRVTPRDTFAHSVGYCAARLAGSLQDALHPSPLPPGLWRIVRTGAVAMLAAHGPSGEAYDEYVAGALCWFGLSGADMPDALRLNGRRDIMVGMAMATVHSSVSAAGSLRAFVTGAPAAGTGVVSTSTDGRGPGATAGACAAGARVAVVPLLGTERGAPAASTPAAVGHGTSALPTQGSFTGSAAAGTSGAAAFGAGAVTASGLREGAAAPGAPGAVGSCTSMVPTQIPSGGPPAAGASITCPRALTGCGGRGEPLPGAGCDAQEGHRVKSEPVNLVDPGGVRLYGQVPSPLCTVHLCCVCRACVFCLLVMCGMSCTDGCDSYMCLSGGMMTVACCRRNSEPHADRCTADVRPCHIV